MPRLTYLVIALLPGVLSQTTTAAICTVDSLSWTFNTLGDSPCQVTADLAGVCSGGVFNLERLDDGSVYPGPTVDTQNSCSCSSVYYSVLSACAACQGRDWIDWGGYDGNCSTIYPGIYPQPIPEGTRVPGWAYADVRATGSFNLTVAASLDVLPESTSAASPKATTSDPDDNQFSFDPLNGPFILVYFGVAALLLAVILPALVYFRERQRSKQPPSSATNTTPDMAAPHNPDQDTSFNQAPMKPITPAQQNPYDLSNPSPVPSNPSPPPSYKSTSSPRSRAPPSYKSTSSPLPQAQTYSPSQGLAVTQV